MTTSHVPDHVLVRKLKENARYDAGRMDAGLFRSYEDDYKRTAKSLEYLESVVRKHRGELRVTGNIAVDAEEDPARYVQLRFSLYEMPVGTYAAIMYENDETLSLLAAEEALRTLSRVEMEKVAECENNVRALRSFRSYMYEAQKLGLIDFEQYILDEAVRKEMYELAAEVQDKIERLNASVRELTSRP